MDHRQARGMCCKHCGCDGRDKTSESIKVKRVKIVPQSGFYCELRHKIPSGHVLLAPIPINSMISHGFSSCPATLVQPLHRPASGANASPLLFVLLPALVSGISHPRR